MILTNSKAWDKHYLKCPAYFVLTGDPSGVFGL